MNPLERQTRIVDDPASDLRRLVATASELAPPAGLQEHVWERLVAPYERLIHNQQEELLLVDLLRRASELEPSDHKRELIWRRLAEEVAARAGLAEPRRLLKTNELGAALLAQEAALEPPYARQARLFRKLQPARPAWSPWRLAALGGALATCVVLLAPFFHGSPQPASPVVAQIPLAVPAGTSFALNAGETSHRWQIEGVGDCVLSGADASVVVASSDSHGVRLHLAHGGLSLHAIKRPQEAPLIIEANGVETQIVGTILTVENVAGGANVFVREGMVKVTAPGRQPAYVGADQAWPVVLARPPVWANRSMSTLAGVTVASRTVAPEPAALRAPEPRLTREAAPTIALKAEKKPEPTPVASTPAAPVPVEVRPTVLAAAPAETHPVTLPAPAPVAAAPAPPLQAPTPVPTKPVVSQVEREVVSVPPAIVALTSTPVAVPAGPGIDLEKEAQIYRGMSAADINEAMDRLPAASRARAVAYYALSRLEDEEGSNNRASATANMISILDDHLGAIELAIQLRRDRVVEMNAEDRSKARLDILEDLVELNRWNEALPAARDCARECSPVFRVFARTLEAQLLRDAGQVDAALRVETEPDGKQKTAFFFSRRAMALQANGQHARARAACRESLTLDPFGYGAADCVNLK